MADDNNPKDEGLTAEEKTQLEADIVSAKKSLVSATTEEAITKAKEEAKKEAAKEFETNAEIERLNAQLKTEQGAKTELEKRSAEELEKIKQKLDSMVGSQMPVENINPFNENANSDVNPVSADGKINTDTLSEEKYRELEASSRDMFLKDKAMGSDKD